MVHISFSVHHLVPFPVDHRTSCDSHLEDLRVVGDQRDCHESAVAPAVHSYPVLIDVRQLHEHLHAFHLVSHLSLTALPVDSLLEFCSTVLCAAVVLDIDQIASLSHVHLPSAKFAGEGVADHLGVRTSIYIDDHRIFP